MLISADGYAVTNFHVTSGSGSFLKCGLNDGQIYDAVIVGIDPTGDVAMVRLLGRSLVVALCEAPRLCVEEDVELVGRNRS